MNMPDPTASRRVAAYRQRQAAGLGWQRVEARVAPRDRAVVQHLAAALRRRRLALAGNRHVVFVLSTINAPRPQAIDADTLLDCLLADHPIDAWRPHLEAFFTEISIEATHDLVLSGVCDFQDLRRAQAIWGPFSGEKHDWIQEMADLTLVRDARRRAADSARTAAGA
jgi:hypothetical protein